jgi:hypothetical protein
MISVDRLKSASGNYVQAGVIRRVSDNIDASAPPNRGNPARLLSLTGAGTYGIARSDANSPHGTPCEFDRNSLVATNLFFATPQHNNQYGLRNRLSISKLLSQGQES